MDYEQDFDDMMCEQNVLNPAKRRYKWFISRTRKNEGPPIPENKDADNTYNAAKRIYIATRIFFELGYDTLIHSSYGDLAQNFIPCKDKSGQCSLFCREKGTCNYEQRTETAAR